MVSFNALFAFASLAVVCSGYSHHGMHKRFQNHPRYFTNGTSIETPYPSVTGHPDVETPVGYPSQPVVTSTPSDIKDHTTTTCITEVATKTYTYTLGNGKAVTTCITQTNVVTKTISITDVPEYPAPTDVSEQPQVPGYPVSSEYPVVSEVPGHSAPSPYPVGPEDQYSSTTTSTTTEILTITRQRPSDVPSVYTTPVGVKGQPSCVPTTVYVPETVYITVPQTVVYSTVTVSIPGVTNYPVTEEPVTYIPEVTNYPIPDEPVTHIPQKPVYTKPVTEAPYHNTTIPTTTPVPEAPYHNTTIPTTSVRYVTVVPYQ